MWDLIRRLTSAEHAGEWAVATWLCDLALTAVIIWRVPFMNVDWEAYTTQVSAVLQGQFDYAQLEGPTGPIAYPGGFCLFYLPFAHLGLEVRHVQIVFGALYLANLAVVLLIYKKVGAPGWLMALCMLSKRLHSIFVLRLFNDGVAQFFMHVSLLLLLQRRKWLSSAVYSFAVGVKMQPLLCCPAVGLCLVLLGGWGEALPLLLVMLLVQALVGLPFLLTNPWGYLQRAFGGPGDLHHEWSVSWRMIPEEVFLSRPFCHGLQAMHLALLLWLAHRRWVPGGLFSPSIWGRSRSNHQLSDRTIVALWLECSLVGIVCLRTMHFQFLAWYAHTVPLVAWQLLRPESAKGLEWALRCVAVAALAIAVEAAFNITGRGQVRGPDGRSWESDGVPTPLGSCVLQSAHMLLLLLLLTGKPLMTGGNPLMTEELKKE